MLDDAYDPVRHGDCFGALARFVCSGLDACGYVYCPGEVMATTDTWRQPLREWRRHFQRWILTPEPRALMLTCVFFDLRTVSGDAALVDDLRREVLALCLTHAGAYQAERRAPAYTVRRLGHPAGRRPFKRRRPTDAKGGPRK